MSLVTKQSRIRGQRLFAAQSAAIVFVIRGNNAKNEIGHGELECNEVKGYQSLSLAAS